MNRTPVIERAFELARSGRFRIPSEIRKAMITDRYTQAELFQLEGKATWRQLRTLCADSYYRASGGPGRPGAPLKLADALADTRSFGD